MGARTILTASLIAASVVLAGCTSTATGNPEPVPDNEVTDTTPPPESSESSDSAPPGSEDDTHGVPRVDNPLDAGRFLADPCALLTPEQLATFGVSQPGEEETGVDGDRACDWRADTVTSIFGIGWLAGNENGLSDQYRVREREAYFEETTVDGYPAVFVDATDGRPSGRCGLVVGITDTLTFVTSEQGRLDAQGACDRVKQVAAAAIATIKGGS